MIAATIVDNENGCAGHVCRPCPNAVTNSVASIDELSASRRRFQCAGSHISRPGAALVFVSGSRVAMVTPGPTSYWVSPYIHRYGLQHVAGHD